jgi:hypothetical protein
MDIDMKHGHRLEAWTWACSMDLDTKNEIGHAAVIRTCSMTMDRSMDMDMLYGYGPAPMTQTSTMEIDMHHGALALLRKLVSKRTVNTSRQNYVEILMPERRNADKKLCLIS